MKMYKYSDETKQTVIDYYHNNGCNKLQTSNHFNISYNVIRKWVDPLYREKHLKYNREQIKEYCNNVEFKKQLSIKANLWNKNNIQRKLETDPIYKKRYWEQCLRSERKRRALKLLILENYTKEDESYTCNLFNNKCAICGSIDRLAIDHWYPLSLWYPLTRNNAVLLCKKCNTNKQNKLPFEHFPNYFESINNKLGIKEFPKPSLGPIAWLLLYTAQFI